MQKYTLVTPEYPELSREIIVTLDNLCLLTDNSKNDIDNYYYDVAGEILAES